MNKLEELKKQIVHYSKQRDDLFADYLRLDGIVAYINNEISKLNAQENLDKTDKTD